MSKVSRNYRRMCEVYKIFADPHLDFSQEAMLEMFLFESRGIGTIDISGFNTTGKKVNGFAVGKKFLNVTVSMWKESMTPGCSGFIGWANQLKILYADPIFPKWWLDQVFEDYLPKKIEEYKALGIVSVDRDENFKPIPIEKTLTDEFRKACGHGSN